MGNFDQRVQFGDQPATQAPEVAFGKHAASASVVTSTPGQDAPGHGDTTTGEDPAPDAPGDDLAG